MAVASVAVDGYLDDSSGYRGEAERVFLPSNVAELREIVLASLSQQIPITIAGAGTGLTGARVPHGGWVVSLERFRHIEIQSGRARCGTGAHLTDLQRAAGQTRQFFGPNPTEASASIGGIISTNAGGARSFHYGSVRRHVLCMEVMFMDGRTVHLERGEPVGFPFKPIRLPATTKNAAGYYLQPGLDWVNLLAGSEGTLGIITEVDLALLPEPATILSGVIFFASDDDALTAVDAWRPTPELRLLEFIDDHGLDLLRPHYPEIPSDARAALLIEQNLASENDPWIERWVERLSDHNALEDESWFGFRPADQQRFREFRHTLPVLVIDNVRRNGFPKFGTDFAVPLHRHRELHAYYKQRCEEVLPGQYTIFGHVGDANNHVNLLPVTREQADKGEKMMYDFARYVVSLGGTVAAEHGIGKNKKDLLQLMYSAEDVDAMRQVKRHLDPHWLLGRDNIFSA